MAKNTVIAGDYKNYSVCSSFGIVSLSYLFSPSITVNKSTVENYEVVDQNSHKSAASAVGRGIAGSLLLGPVGLLAGLSAKSVGTHVLALQFKDGKKSLLEIDDSKYKAIIKALF